LEGVEYWFYVPSTTSIDMLPLKRRLEEMFIDAFGGFTAISASGGWKSPSEKVIMEPVVVYQCVDIKMAATTLDIEAITTYIKEAYEQESVLVISRPAWQF